MSLPTQLENELHQSLSTLKERPADVLSNAIKSVESSNLAHEFKNTESSCMPKEKSVTANNHEEKPLPSIPEIKEIESNEHAVPKPPPLPSPSLLSPNDSLSLTPNKSSSINLGASIRKEHKALMPAISLSELQSIQLRKTETNLCREPSVVLKTGPGKADVILIYQVEIQTLTFNILHYGHYIY